VYNNFSAVGLLVVLPYQVKAFGHVLNTEDITGIKSLC